MEPVALWYQVKPVSSPVESGNCSTTSSMNWVSNMSSTNTITLLLRETVVSPSSVTTRSLEEVVGAFATTMPRLTPWARAMTRQMAGQARRMKTARLRANRMQAAIMAAQMTTDAQIAFLYTNQFTYSPVAAGRNPLSASSWTIAATQAPATTARTSSKALPRNAERTTERARAQARELSKRGAHTSENENERLEAPVTTTTRGDAKRTAKQRAAQDTRETTKRLGQVRGEPSKAPVVGPRRVVGAEVAASGNLSGSTALMAVSTALPAFSSTLSTLSTTRRRRLQATPMTADSATATPARAWMV